MTTTFITNTERRWEPATIAQGKYKGMTVGFFNGFQEIPYTNEETGEIFTIQKALFTIKGKNNDTQDLPVNVSHKYGEDNNLGKLAKALGFVYQATTEIDEFGQEVEKGNNLDELADLFADAEKNHTPICFKMRRIKKSNAFGDIYTSGLWEVDPSVDPVVMSPKA